MIRSDQMKRNSLNKQNKLVKKKILRVGYTSHCFMTQEYKNQSTISDGSYYKNEEKQYRHYVSFVALLIGRVIFLGWVDQLIIT